MDSGDGDIHPERAVLAIPLISGVILSASGIFVSAVNWSVRRGAMGQVIIPLLILGGAGGVFVALAIFLRRPTRGVIIVSMICGSILLAMLVLAVMGMAVGGLMVREVSVVILAMTLGIMLQIDWLVRLFRLHERLRPDRDQGFPVIMNAPERPEKGHSDAR